MRLTLLLGLALAIGTCLLTRAVLGEGPQVASGHRHINIPTRREAEWPRISFPKSTEAVAEAAPAPPPSDGDVLAQMMTDHQEAMLLLREALFYELFPRLEPCGDVVKQRSVCWVHFDCALQGQMMESRIKSIDCGGDRVLEACSQERLSAGVSPLGVPEEAVSELGPYRGPVDVFLTWYPRAGS